MSSKRRRALFGPMSVRDTIDGSCSSALNKGYNSRRVKMSASTQDIPLSPPSHLPEVSVQVTHRTHGDPSTMHALPVARPYVDLEQSHPQPSPSQAPSASQAPTRRQRKGLPAAVGGKPVPTEYSHLDPPTVCPKCGATKFMYESKGFCCSDGQVRLASNNYPEQLVDLFTGNHEDSIHFRTYARLYNNLFAFTSLGGSFDSRTEKGIYVFKAHGQMYHFVPDLLPHDKKPRYLQLYFYDVQHEKDNRLGFFPELRPQVVSVLMDIMRENPYACFFKSLSDLNVSDDTRILLNHNSSLDQRVYNAPTAEEVAAVWLDCSSSEETSGPHIVVYGKSDKPHRIMHYYGCYDPLQYPLLFPRGDCGWHQGLHRIPKDDSLLHNPRFMDVVTLIRNPGELLVEEAWFPGPHTPHFMDGVTLIQDPSEILAQEEQGAPTRPGRKGKHISCKEYYAYKLQIRPANYLLNAGRLFQQYLVDMYVKLENTRLDFYRKYQDIIRADLYQGIIDTVIQGEYDASNVGYRVILPPSFIGGPRDMRRRYLNSMALVQKYGKPDLFVTMTCNPNWPELKAQVVLPGEQSQNRPDLVARVFRAKLLALKKQIMEKKVFGEVAALIYVVEFQKRGLPHAHFLIILKTGHKIQNPEKFDSYSSAEIPSSENAHLRAAVSKHMMHGPCGVANPSCPCMRQDGQQRRCKSGYPKPFSAFTTTGNDCYPLYRRRDTGETVCVRRAELNNQWVVPYNPYLLAMFDCHLNVEICSSVKAVKYLYKYVYKGHDRVSFSIVQETGHGPVDEIERYQAGRWVSPPEAAWRIFGFDLFEMTPPVMPLPVHTKNMHLVRFNERDSLENIANDQSTSKTMLTEFFMYNAQNPSSKRYLYSEFPEHFTWDYKRKAWQIRKRGLMVGRLSSAAPSDGERYYLRLLLTNVPGPTSFVDLLTVSGYECATFQESAMKRGLLESDESVEQCMDEAVESQMPHALRRLFATILIFCEPNDPKKFWSKYYKSLSEDFRRSYPENENMVLQLTSQKVEVYLEGMGKTFAHFNLSHLHDVQDEGLRQTRDIVDALEAPVPEQYNSSRKQLNTRQKDAYKAIIQRVKAEKPGVFFIDGPGGTGKTFLYCALYAKVRLMGKICIPTTSSGIAASNIPTGRTAHSRFKIPTDDKGSITCEVPKQSGLASLLRQTSLIIWDEASMAKKDNIEALDLLLRDLCSSNLPFGGKVIVFGGDFRQVLPVLPRRTQYEAVEASLVSSHLWATFEKFRLTENVRASEDPIFSKFLLQLGNGSLQSEENGCITLPPNVILRPTETSHGLHLLTNKIFPELQSDTFPSEIFTQRAILTPRNDDVDFINSEMIQRFPGYLRTYKSFDSVIDDNCAVYPVEFLNTLCPGGMSPHELNLKENCPVILLRNLDPAAGLCNGTRLICRRFLPNMIECEISAGYYQGEQVFLPRITLKPSASSKYPFQFQRKQFPIKLSFAMTINKAQGQTLQRVGVYLPHPCFSHGQLYVALSRARTATQLNVMLKTTENEPQENNLVKNVISYEVLRRAHIIEA